MSSEPGYALASSTWDDRELAAMQRVIGSGRFTMGDEVAQFERAFAGFVGTEHAVMVNSGSSANLALFAALQHHTRWAFPQGGEVIVPAVSWGTTYYPVAQHGLTLRFVDVAQDDWNLDVELVRAALSERTVGVFAVNLLGAPAPLLELRRLCDEAGVFLIEDNCESLGAALGGRTTGSIGFAGTHSTFFSHHICTMEGGLVTTDDDELRDLLVSIRAHGWLRGLPAENHVHPLTGDPFLDSFTFVLPGYNLRPIELAGATGSEQLVKLPAMLDQRRLNATDFCDLVDGIPWVRPQRPTGESSWFGFGMVLSPEAPVTRAELTRTFAARGIECRPIVAGNFTRNPVMQHLPHAPLAPLPVADELHERGFFVGNHHLPMARELELLQAALTDLGATGA
jgi:CDP-4-dehydro-6-deoxyglucose reductase, E1